MREFASFGAGVQSTAIALLAHNQDERLLKVTGGKTPEAYIFADTGDEPESIYPHLERMQQLLDVPLHVVHRYDGTSLQDKLCGRLESGKDTNLTWIPAFVVSSNGDRVAPLQRRCTFNMKVQALDRAQKQLAEVPRKTKNVQGPIVRAWLGISLDEMQRMKESSNWWQQFFYPLVEMGWRRGDCIRYLKEHGYEPVRSACVYCPFRNDREWQRMKDENPRDFEAAVQFERRLHKAVAPFDSIKGGLPYLHPSRVPIDQVEFDKQLGLPLGMDNECSGVCGV